MVGRPGPEVFHRRGKWEPSEWRGQGENHSSIRRRTPPASWVSGRHRHWLVWVPPRSSCLRPSSSSGTA